MMMIINNISVSELSKEEMIQLEGGIPPLIIGAGWLLGYAAGAAVGAGTVWAVVEMMR